WVAGVAGRAAKPAERAPRRKNAGNWRVKSSAPAGENRKRSSNRALALHRRRVTLKGNRDWRQTAYGWAIANIGGRGRTSCLFNSWSGENLGRSIISFGLATAAYQLKSFLNNY